MAPVTHLCFDLTCLTWFYYLFLNYIITLDFNGDYNDSDEMDNPAQFSENEISPKQSMNNEKSLMQSKSCTPPITKVEQKDPENEFIDEIPEQEDQNGMDNHEEYLNENEHQNSNCKNIKHHTNMS